MSPAEREELRSLARQARAQLGTQKAVAQALGVSPRMVRKLEAGSSGVSHVPALRAITEQRFRDATAAAAERQQSGRARAAKAPVLVDRAAGQEHTAGRSSADELAERVRALGTRGRTGGVAITFDYVDRSGRTRTGTLYDGWKGPAGASGDWLAAELEEWGSLDAFIAEHASDSYGVDVGSVSGVTVTAV